MKSLILKRILPVKRGALAEVFFDGQHAFKVYKKPTHPDYFGEDSFDVARNIQAFESESAAYEIGNLDRELKIHLPNFFGKVKVDLIQDTTGKSISEFFVLECCLKLERLHGEDRKYGEVVSERPYLEVFAQRLKQSGIEHVLDASVFAYNSKFEFKFIDIATRDAATDYDMMAL